MIKKLLVAVTLFLGIATSIHAQNFSITANPLYAIDTIPQQDFQLVDAIVNLSATDSITLTWKIVSISFTNPSWELTGMCDNATCYLYGIPTEDSVTHTTYSIAPNDTCPMLAHFMIPDPNGIGIVKQRIVSAGQTDTLTWCINCTSPGSPTGISMINKNDSHVIVYPNPSTSENTAILYADKSIGASKISVINIMGQTIMNADASQSSEYTTLNIASLSKGIYYIKLINNKGQIITTKKFARN